MFKLFFMGLLIYLAYRFFIASPSSSIDKTGKSDDFIHGPSKGSAKTDDSEYVDYEEVKEQ
ncbi:MAG: hypothetical protein HUU34_12000 [Saprospiraceae bacterium]|nr:hypothetical protein [Saprospiraceae bacterium]